jgi:hypothetical protein
MIVDLFFVPLSESYNLLGTSHGSFEVLCVHDTLTSLVDTRDSDEEDRSCGKINPNAKHVDL